MIDGVTAEQIGTTPPQELRNSVIPDEPRDDLRADINAAIEKLSQNPAEKPVAAADEGDQGSPSSSPDRLRNERGQFTKADETSTVPAEQITDAAQVQETAQEQPSTALQPPKTWSADEKALWASLDPALQKAVARREEEQDNGWRQMSEEKRAYEQQLQPLSEYAQRYQIDSGTALTRLLDWQRALETNPAQALAQLAQLSGIDLSNPTQQFQPQNAYDPRFDGVVATVSELQQTHINGQIEAFKASPGHEHFDTVRVEMGRMMERDPNLSMQDAYDRAVWLDPTVRASLIQQQIQPTQQKAKDQQQVLKAKSAAVTPKGTGPTGNAPVPKPEFGSVREALVAAAREHGWGV